MPGLTDPADGQSVSDSTVGGDVTQIGSARDVSIGAHLPPRPPLPDAASTPAPAGLKGLPRRRAAVFVGRDEAARLPDVLAAAKGQALLVVTESDNALAQGATINFVPADDKVRFDVALAAAERGGLRISSRLLAVARKVLPS